MRYAICFTPRPNDLLTLAAANWLGRNVYSGEMTSPAVVRGMCLQEVAFYTAVPRRYGFSGSLKAPFRLREGVTEAGLLRDLLHFCGKFRPFEIPRLVIARLDGAFGLVPSDRCPALCELAAAVVQEFDSYREPLNEAELDRCDPGGLSASEFANLHRWGCPHVLDDFRFQMMLTGPAGQADAPRLARALDELFAPVLSLRVPFANIALLVEEGSGGPFRVHSLHPLGKVSARKAASAPELAAAI
jgi:hypothetical protein